MVRPLPPRPSSQGRRSPRRRRPAPCGPVVVAAHCSILLMLMLMLLLLSATCLSSARRRSPRRVWPCRSDRRGPPRPTTPAAGGLVPPATATAAPVPSAHAIPRCAPRPVRCGGRPDDPRPSPTRRLCVSVVYGGACQVSLALEPLHDRRVGSFGGKRTTASRLQQQHLGAPPPPTAAAAAAAAVHAGRQAAGRLDRRPTQRASQTKRATDTAPPADAPARLSIAISIRPANLQGNLAPYLGHWARANAAAGS